MTARLASYRLRTYCLPVTVTCMIIMAQIGLMPVHAGILQTIGPYVDLGYTVSDDEEYMPSQGGVFSVSQVYTGPSISGGVACRLAELPVTLGVGATEVFGVPYRNATLDSAMGPYVDLSLGYAALERPRARLVFALTYVRNLALSFTHSSLFAHGCYSRHLGLLDGTGFVGMRHSWDRTRLPGLQEEDAFVGAELAVTTWALRPYVSCAFLYQLFNNRSTDISPWRGFVSGGLKLEWAQHRPSILDGRMSSPNRWAEID